jgi:hypothetical protein
MAKKKSKKSLVGVSRSGHALAAGSHASPQGHSISDGTFNHQRPGERGNSVKVSARRALREGKRKAKRTRKR